MDHGYMPASTVRFGTNKGGPVVCFGAVAELFVEDRDEGVRVAVRSQAGAGMNLFCHVLERICRAEQSVGADATVKAEWITHQVGGEDLVVEFSNAI